jgi:hypothetical protein
MKLTCKFTWRNEESERVTARRIEKADKKKKKVRKQRVRAARKNPV